MAVAQDPDAEGDGGGGAGVSDGVPVLTWQDDARMGRSFDQVALLWEKKEKKKKKRFE